MSSNKKKVKNKNKKYQKRKSLKKQLRDRMESLNNIGESRHLAKQDYIENIANGEFSMNRTVGVHSKGTMKTYRMVVSKFIDYVRDVDPAVKDLEDITKQHCEDYLRYRADVQGVRPTTYSKDISALNKVFRYDLNKKDLNLRPKNFNEYVNNRGLKEHHNRINLLNYKNEILLGWATGMRDESYNVINKRRFTRGADGLYKSVWLKEKGGKWRDATILLEHRKAVTDFLDSLEIDENDQIFKNKIPDIFPSHRIRQVYAQDLYDQVANNLEGYKKGYLGYDERAVLSVSKNLGHNRQEVIKSYLHVTRSINPREIVFGAKT